MMKRLAVVFLCATLSGCVWAVAGGAGAAGAYFWVKGNLERNYHQPLATAWEGTLHATRVLRLKVVSQEHDAFNGYINAKMAKGEDVRIKLERWTDTETRITVRVGALGDEAVSRKIHKEIEKALR